MTVFYERRGNNEKLIADNMIDKKMNLAWAINNFG
jgi:hypothetical protein